ncbi:MAG TPA: alanine racemase [Thermoleophilaceae bacterium]
MTTALPDAVLDRLLEQLDTPFYVLDLDAVEAAYRAHLEAWREGSDSVTVAYPYKANPLSGLTTLLRELGAAADVGSGTELEWALDDGFEPASILFSGPVKRRPELARAVDVGALVQVDALDELDALLSVAAAAERTPRVSLRLTTRYGPGWSRFGLLPDEAAAAARRLRSLEIPLEGFHFHGGSNLTGPELHVDTIERSAELIRSTIAGAAGRVVLDCGGGYPTTSLGARGDAPPIEAFARRVVAALHANGIERDAVHLVVEPGRALAEQAGTLVARVIGTKARDGRRIATIDAGGNLVRSNRDWQHGIRFARGPGDGTVHYAVYGALCLEGDRFAASVPGPEDLAAEDVVIVEGAGAYDMAAAAPWMRPLPPVVGHRGGETWILRDAQTRESVRANERALTAWLPTQRS